MLLCQKDPCQVFPHVAYCLMLYDSFSFLKKNLLGAWSIWHLQTTVLLLRD